MQIKDRENLYNTYKTKWVWKSVKDWQYIQCVSMAKHYAKESYKEILPSFWGSAYTGYVNRSNTFNSQWKQVPYKNWDVPTVWDIWFHWPTKSNQYWHVFIVGIWSDPNKLVRLEQNYVAWNSPHFWKWTWPASITERTWSYKDVVGFWRYMWA